MDRARPPAIAGIADRTFTGISDRKEQHHRLAAVLQQNVAGARGTACPTNAVDPSVFPRDTTHPRDDLLGEAPMGTREPDADEEVEFVGPEVEPPAGLGLKPLSHRRYHNKLVKVRQRPCQISVAHSPGPGL